MRLTVSLLSIDPLTGVPIKRQPPPTNVFEYTEGVSAEVQTFVKTNYDISEYEIDFKELAKLKKEKAKQEQEAAAAKAARTSAQQPRPESTRSQEEKRGLYRTG